MFAAVTLREIINEMAEVGNNHTAFLNRKTGELFTMNHQQRTLLENAMASHDLSDGQHQVREAMDAGDLLELPSSYEHREFATIERFCDSVHEPKHKKKLLKAIRGKNAVTSFRRVIGKLGIEQQWTGFRNRRLEQIAVDWLNDNDIRFDKAA